MSLKKYINEAEQAKAQPVTGDTVSFTINGIKDVKATVVEHADGHVVLELDETQLDELLPVIAAGAGALARGAAAAGGALARGAAKAVVGTGVKAAVNKLDKALFGPSLDNDDEPVQEDSGQVQEGDVVRIDYPTEHEGELGQVVELAPSGSFAYVQFKDGDIESYHVSDLLRVSDEEEDAYFDQDEQDDDGEFDESLGQVKHLAGMSEIAQTTPGYDTGPGSPYDRGKSDAYYGRRGNPTKVVDKVNSTVRGEREIIKLTDPEEIKQYYAGYEGSEFGEKDYGTFPDTSDDEVDEGFMKSIKRGLQGWSNNDTDIMGNPSKPKDVVKRAKDLDDETAKSISNSYDKYPPSKHSPADIQNRTLKKRLSKEDLDEGAEVSFYVEVVDTNTYDKKTLTVDAVTADEARAKAEAKGYKVLKVTDSLEVDEATMTDMRRLAGMNKVTEAPAQMGSYLGVKALKAPPLKNYRPAMWENMFGTVYAMNDAKEVKYFDYDHKSAIAYAGIGPDSAPRLYRIDRHAAGRPHGEYSYGGEDDYASPRHGKLVLFIKKNTSPDKVSEISEPKLDRYIAKRTRQGANNHIDSVELAHAKVNSKHGWRGKQAKVPASPDPRPKDTYESVAVYIKESKTGELMKVYLPADIVKGNNSWTCNLWTKK